MITSIHYNYVANYTMSTQEQQLYATGIRTDLKSHHPNASVDVQVYNPNSGHVTQLAITATNSKELNQLLPKVSIEV